MKKITLLCFLMSLSFSQAVAQVQTPPQPTTEKIQEKPEPQLFLRRDKPNFLPQVPQTPPPAIDRLITTEEMRRLGDKGNGGDAVVCRDDEGSIVSAQLLDHFEGRNIDRTQFVDHSEVSLMDYVAEVATAMGECNPELYASLYLEATTTASSLNDVLLKARAPSLKRHSFFQDVPNVTDSNHALVLDPGCNVEQLVVRANPEESDRRAVEYFWQAHILEKLSLADLKGVVLHEVIYKARIQGLQEQNSVNTRRIVRTIAEFEHGTLRNNKAFCQAIDL